MTPEQKRALALAAARLRLSQRGEAAAQPAQESAAARVARLLPQSAPPYQPPTMADMIGGERVDVGTPDPAFVAEIGQRRREAETTPISARMAGAANAAAMSFADEAGAAMISPFVDDSYSDVLNVLRQSQSANAEARPGAYFLGGLAGAVPLAITGVGAIKAAPTLLGKMATGAGVGAGAGAVSGFGEGEGGVGPRVQSALQGAGIGFGIGGAIPVLGAAGKQAFSMAADALRNSRIGSQVGSQVGVSPATGKILASLIGEGDDAAMREAMGRAGGSAMLGVAAPGVAGVLDASMRSAAPGAAVARTRIDARAGLSRDRLLDALMGGQQGPRMPPVANQTARAAGARPTINPLYQEAYDTPIDYASSAGAAIENLFSRLPPGVAQKAINAASDRMRYDELPNAQIMASIAEDGRVSFSQMPNVMQLDYIKRAFDQIAQDSKDAVTGRMSGDGAFANTVARDIRGLLADAVPKYGEALDAAATDIRERGAIRIGQDALRPQTAVEDVLSDVSDATPAELRAMREGVMAQIDNVLGNVRAVASDPNLDAREALKVFGDLSSRNAGQKLKAIFGDRWPDIQARLQEAQSALGLRARLALGSQTQPRQVADQMITEQIAPGPLRSLQPIATLREIGQRGMGADPASVERAGRNVRGELADVLTRPNAQTQYDAIVNALSANPANPALGNGVQNAVTLGGLMGVPALSVEMRKILGLQPVRGTP